jgi:hypothetical protein
MAISPSGAEALHLFGRLCGTTEVVPLLQNFCFTGFFSETDALQALNFEQRREPCGTTEVVPCYRTSIDRVFSKTDALRAPNSVQRRLKQHGTTSDQNSS